MKLSSKSAAGCGALFRTLTRSTVFAVIGGMAALGGTPVPVPCPPGGEHGLGLTATCNPRCVGELTDCTASARYLDDYPEDTTKLTSIAAVVHHGDGDEATSVLPIILVSGNAVCTDDGGVCNAATGENCALPCLLCSAGEDGTDGTLQCPGLPQPGRVQFAMRSVTIRTADVGGFSTTFTFGHRDLCDTPCEGGGAPPGCTTVEQFKPQDAATSVPNCNDGNVCSIDCCALGVCSNPTTCEGAVECRGVDGQVTTIPPLVCDDNNECTGPDACDASAPNSTPQACCSFPPIICDPAPTCFTRGECDPQAGCPPLVSVCDNPNFSCDDQNACTLDSCDDTAVDSGCCDHEPVVCEPPPACFTRGECDPASGCPPVVSVCDDPGFSCDDQNACTTDTCNDASTGTGCCDHAPITCDPAPACFTRGPCDPATGCPDPVSVCDDPGFSCDDGDPCTEDVCDDSATGTGCCVHRDICECGDGNIDPGELCDGSSRADGVKCTNACEGPSDPNPCTCCGDHVRQPDENCDGDQFEPGAPSTHGSCRGDCTYCGDGTTNGREECDDGNDNNDDECRNDCTRPQQPATCRTPGFWGTHACGANGKVCEKSRSKNVTQAALDACGGCVEVCGDVIDTTVLGNADSALEAMCVSVKGTQVLQLARQLTAAALNCCISDAPGCGGLGIADLFAECNAACAAGNTSVQVNGTSVNCIAAIDCFNNGGQYQGGAAFCATGNCSDNGAPCSSGNRSLCSDPATATCVPFVSTCHDLNVGLCADGSICTEQLPCASGNCGSTGPAGSSNACNAATGNKCNVVNSSIGSDGCSTGSNGAQSCP